VVQVVKRVLNVVELREQAGKEVIVVSELVLKPAEVSLDAVAVKAAALSYVMENVVIAV